MVVGNDDGFVDSSLPNDDDDDGVPGWALPPPPNKEEKLSYISLQLDTKIRSIIGMTKFIKKRGQVDGRGDSLGRVVSGSSTESGSCESPLF